MKAVSSRNLGESRTGGGVKAGFDFPQGYSLRRGIDAGQ
jgi:hypothetical protein